MLSIFLFFTIQTVEVEGPKAQITGISSFLDWIAGHSSELKSLDRLIDASKSESRVVDLEISPRLEGEWNEVWDNRTRASSNSLEIDRAGSLSVLTPTVLGTEFGLFGNYTKRDVSSSLLSGNHEWDWAAQISQPLLSDFFGRGIRAKRRSERLVIQARVAKYMASQAAALLEFESLYWDLFLADREQAAHEKNLKRSLEILSWVRERMKRSAAEKTDLFQAESLLAKRELELQTIRDRSKRLQLSLKQRLDSDEIPSFRFDARELNATRDWKSFVAGSPNSDSPKKLQALAVQFESLAEQNRALALSDSARPRLDAIGRVGTNGIRSQVGNSLRDSFGNPIYELGIKFSPKMNFMLLIDLQRAARRSSDAHEIQAKRGVKEAELAWADFASELDRNRERVATAHNLFELEKRKISL